jgi:hypothetical protein
LRIFLVLLDCAQQGSGALFLHTSDYLRYF